MKRFPAIIVAIGIGLMFHACSDSRTRKAAEMGERDAHEFAQSASDPGTSQLRNIDFILNVRYKERRLRDAGFDKAADKYISSFQTSLLEADSTLYVEIFPQ